MTVKRPIHDKIDIFFLLHQNKIVTRTELANILPLQNYNEYIASYYKRKLIEIFLKNYEFKWFTKRYFGERPKLKHHSFDIRDKYIVINSLTNYYTEDDLENILKGVKGYNSHVLSQPDVYKGYRRICYILINDEEDLEERVEDIKSAFNDFKLDIGIENIDVEIEKHHTNINKECLENIFKTLCKLYKIDEKEAKKIYQGPITNDSSFYSLILRHCFLFCSVCCSQYDSPLEFLTRCSNHDTSDVSSRKRELINNYGDFSYLKNVSIEYLLGRNINKIDEKVYKCCYCEKKFESENFINLHYNKKHKEEILERENKYKSYQLFVDNLDLYILNLSEGSSESAPWFTKRHDDKKIVYDMRHVFSGEIVLD